MTQNDKNIFKRNINPFKNKGKNTLILDLLIIMFVIMMAFGATVVLREYVITVTQVKGASMENTLAENDRVYLLNIGKVKRGDIVRAENPLYNPEKDDKYIIKRVIALSGDEVKIPGDGCVYVNGGKIEESYTKEPESTYYRSYDNDAYKDGGIVPEGYIFVLGDNRINSADSRFFGAIKEDDVHGRAFMIERDGKREWL
jgi:signal peptidase I